jgi:hypothetical protein
VTGIIDNSKTDERRRWVELLHAGWMYHQQEVKRLSSPIMGAELTDDELFHMALSVAIQDCMALIQQLEAFGYFDEGDEEDELSKPGPAG